MKIKLSPLAAGISGSAADAVGSRWKGRYYVRQRVIPKNPRSDAQVAVRDSMTRCVTLFRSLMDPAKLALDRGAEAFSISGWNLFTKLNRAAEQAGELLTIVPGNPACHAVYDLEADTSTPGTIKLTWTNPNVSGYTKVYVALRKTDENEFSHQSTTTNITQEELQISDLGSGDYQCYIAPYNPTTNDVGTQAATEATVT